MYFGSEAIHRANNSTRKRETCDVFCEVRYFSLRDRINHLNISYSTLYYLESSTSFYRFKARILYLEYNKHLNGDGDGRAGALKQFQFHLGAVKGKKEVHLRSALLLFMTCRFLPVSLQCCAANLNPED